MHFNIVFIQQVGLLKWVTRYAWRQFEKRVLRRPSLLRLPTGAQIILPAQSLNATEVFVTNADMDWGAEGLFAHFALANTDFLDVGAHIGYYSAYLSPLVRKVVAFEPDPRNISDLRRNAKILGNVTVVEQPVSAYSEEVFFAVSESSAISHITAKDDQFAISMRSISIDEYVSQNPDLIISLIKTDAEGHDLDVIVGARETINKFSPLILTECELNADLEEFVSSVNYRIYAFIRKSPSAPTEFKRLEFEPNGTTQNSTKMLFLAPPRLYEDFEKALSRLA